LGNEKTDCEGQMSIFLKIMVVTFVVAQVHAQEVIPYDWSRVLEVPPGAGINEGSQVLHFKCKNKHYTASPEATQFVQINLLKAQKLQSDAEVILAASKAVTIPNGVYLELGVCTGKTINFIAALNPHHTIYGFDSFEGLPEDWVRSDKTFKKGTFAFKKGVYLPPVLHNVRLYKGFKDVLPKFKADALVNRPIAFMHIDSDIYSSAKTVFDSLGDNIVPGTVILFDELYNYPGSEQHEWKALKEFLEAKKLGVEFIAYNENHEQVAVKIIAKT
jgi:hypothetical protein